MSQLCLPLVSSIVLPVTCLGFSWESIVCLCFPFLSSSCQLPGLGDFLWGQLCLPLFSSTGLLPGPDDYVRASEVFETCIQCKVAWVFRKVYAHFKRCLLDKRHQKLVPKGKRSSQKVCPSKKRTFMPTRIQKVCSS